MEVSTENISQQLNIADEQIKPGVCPLYRSLKRIFDFVMSLGLSAVLLVPICLVCIAVVAADYGSPFFLQTRVGYQGRLFRIVKFRTMKTGADRLEDMLSPEDLKQYLKEFKLKDDPRLIGWKNPGDSKKCFGAFLRRSSIDEIPQILFNICILGNMSLVGPRPILEDELKKNYSPEEQKILLSVKPGLTGYWQAYARNDATYETGERQRMELYYAQNANAWLDIKILFATVGAVIKKQGAV